MLYQFWGSWLEPIALDICIAGLKKQDCSAQSKLAYAFSGVLEFGHGVRVLGV